MRDAVTQRQNLLRRNLHCCCPLHRCVAPCAAGNALVECSSTVSKLRPKSEGPSGSAGDLGYEDVAEAAFGSWGKACVSATIYAELFGICRCPAIAAVVMRYRHCIRYANSFAHPFGAQSKVAGGDEYKLCWCSLFFVIMGNNLHHLLASSSGRSPAFYTLIAAAAMIPTVWLPDLKALSYLGFAGVSATAAVTLTVSACALNAGCRNSPRISQVPQTAEV